MLHLQASYIEETLVNEWLDRRQRIRTGRLLVSPSGVRKDKNELSIFLKLFTTLIWIFLNQFLTKTSNDLKTFYLQAIFL